MALLIDDLKSEDANARLKSIRSLDQIALALGPKRTRDEFVPFLCECVEDDDELLIEMAHKALTLVDPAGGPAHAHVLLPLLRQLACGDSKLVRDEAVASLLALSEGLGAEDFDAHFVPLVRGLLSGEWYNQNTSGLALVPALLRRTRNQTVRAAVLDRVDALSKTGLPMVRRAVAEMLGACADSCTAQELVNSVRALFATLSSDSQDAVKAVSISAVAHILSAVNRQMIGPHTGDVSSSSLGQVRDEVYKRFSALCTSEESWRLRYACADWFANAIETYLGHTKVYPRVTLKRDSAENRDCTEQVDPIRPIANAPGASSFSEGQAFPPFQEAEADADACLRIYRTAPEAPAGAQYDEATAARSFAKLLCDEEAEVRCIAGQRLVRVCSRLSQGAITSVILPQVADRIANDDALFVRAALARNVVGLGAILGKEDTLKHVKPLLQKQLEDADAEVRVTALLNLPFLAATTTLQPLTSCLYSAIVVLSEDANWRVRKQTIQAVTPLAPLLGQQFFDDKLGALCLNWLGDAVNYIRRTAVKNLVSIGKEFGDEWCSRVLVAKINSMKQNPNYLHRINTLYFIQELAAVVSPDIVAQQLLPVAVKLSTDAVPNVKFAAAEALGKMSKRVSQQYRDTQIKTCLLSLRGDPDPDVKAFAAEALKML